MTFTRRSTVRCTVHCAVKAITNVIGCCARLGKPAEQRRGRMLRATPRQHAKEVVVDDPGVPTGQRGDQRTQMTEVAFQLPAPGEALALGNTSPWQ